MGARLLYRDAQGRDASVDIPPEGVFLGRATDCAVRTDDAMVSRKNCKISLQNGRWMVEDLGSSNGTFVNEQRIQKQALAHADVVRCGSLQVRFVETADPAPAAVQKPKTMSLEATSAPASVQVSPELTGELDAANLMALKDQELQTVAMERDALAARLQEVAHELEGMQARQEADQAELKKLRGELLQNRERLTDLQRQKSLQDDELHAQTRVAQELRAELDGIREEHLKVKARHDELVEELQARDRQLERAHEDVQRAKQLTDELRQAVAELQRTKDEGWRELNNRVGELDNLREVIREQERILEERRVGLISFEAQVKELRGDKEQVQRELIAVKTERDGLRDKANKQQTQIDALEEEHRRLARALAEGAAAGAAADEHARMATELREAKVELRKLESERARLAEQVARLEAEQKLLDEKHAHTDVERGQLEEKRAAAEAARARAEDALAQAEAALARADDERAQAAKARDAALATSDELRREVERERKRADEAAEQLAALKGKLDELEQVCADLQARNAELGEALARAGEATSAPETTSPGMPAVTSEDLAGDAADGQVAAAEARIRELEEELASLAAQLALAQEQGAGGAGQAAQAAGGDEIVIEIKRRAEEAYTGINDCLSELRTNILLAHGLLGTSSDEETVRTLTEAIQISMDRTEDAKGLLRSLREVFEA